MYDYTSIGDDFEVLVDHDKDRSASNIENVPEFLSQSPYIFKGKGQPRQPCLKQNQWKTNK